MVLNISTKLMLQLIASYDLDHSSLKPAITGTSGLLLNGREAGLFVSVLSSGPFASDG